ncbi:hypothetical protein ACFQZS_02715 [Mucilaginibacter calamicampi]|uniref:LTXXQ motif family protein n=1 Tax=Mucilaginibacter calamicampi TaxID=1302352 RepID=A0ABW2YUT3_9SPHI
MKNRIVLLAAALLFASVLKAQQPPPPGGMRLSPEERLKRATERLGKELALKPDQKQKLTAAFKDFFASMEKLRGDGPPPPPPPPGKKEDVDKLVAARDKKLKTILTATQFKKYQQIEKEMRMRRPGGPPDGRGGPPQGPPPPPRQ